MAATVSTCDASASTPGRPRNMASTAATSPAHATRSALVSSAASSPPTIAATVGVWRVGGRLTTPMIPHMEARLSTGLHRVRSGEAVANHGGEIVGDGCRQLGGRSLDHHPHERLGPARPDEHATLTV